MIKMYSGNKIIIYLYFIIYKNKKLSILLNLKNAYGNSMHTNFAKNCVNTVLRLKSQMILFILPKFFVSQINSWQIWKNKLHKNTLLKFSIFKDSPQNCIKYLSQRQ